MCLNIQATHLQRRYGCKYISEHPSDTHAYLWQRFAHNSCNKAVRPPFVVCPLSSVLCCRPEKLEHVSSTPKASPTGKTAEKEKSRQAAAAAGKHKSRKAAKQKGRMAAAAHVAPPLKMSAQIDWARLQPKASKNRAWSGYGPREYPLH